MTNQPEHPTVSQASRFAQIALTLGTLVLAALLFSPFFSPILWAVVLSYALYPLYGRVLRATGGREALSAFLMCTVMTVGLLLPLFYWIFPPSNGSFCGPVLLNALPEAAFPAFSSA